MVISVEELTSAIEARFGVCPKYLTLSKDSPPLQEHLFTQARFAYLDAPFPALFKEELFTYLSRFCPVPYCLLRHAAFLVGRGYPCGDLSSDVLTPAELVQLLRTPIPGDDEFGGYLNVLQLHDWVGPLEHWPARNSELERSLFFAAVSLFLERGPFTAFRTELRRIIGSSAFDHFVIFLSFVRSAHYWVEMHPELSPERDVEELITENPALAEWLKTYQSNVAAEFSVAANQTIALLKLAVQRNETRHDSLNDILEHSLNEIYLFDELSLRFIHANQGACDNLGYSLEELRELTPLHIKPEMTPDSFAALLEPLRNKDKSKIDFTTLHRRKDGSTYPVEVHLQRSQFDSTPVFLAVILDITERAKIEDALAQARLILESAPDATIIVNGAGKVQISNSQTSSLFGYTQQELRHMEVEALLPERFRNIHVTHRQRFAADPKIRGMGANLNLFAVTKSGQEFPIEVSLSPIQTANGTLIAAAIRDSTARKAIEHALKQAKAVAESATVTKSRFLAAASHDLRQPLHSLRLYLAVLTRQFEQPKLQEVSAKMGQSLDTMGELLDALLDISKFDGSSITPDKQDFCIRTLLDRIVTDNVQQAHEKNLQLTCSSDTSIVYSDAGLLERVIENFVTNAIRYTESGSVTIGCKRGKTTLRISVSDTGVGIPGDNLDKIFEEYYQINNDSRDRRKGLGLGLAIVKHIARLLEHRLDVKSVPGEGSVFAIDVPLGDMETEQTAPPAAVQTHARGESVPVVLIVDDDPAIVDATTMLLEYLKVKVHSAASGEEALAEIDAGITPDILIADYRLPGCNGIEVIQRVRQATTADLPVIIMTGDTSAHEIATASLSNCTILHKPVGTNQIVELIERLLAE